MYTHSKSRPNFNPDLWCTYFFKTNIHVSWWAICFLRKEHCWGGLVTVRRILVLVLLVWFACCPHALLSIFPPPPPVKHQRNKRNSFYLTILKWWSHFQDVDPPSIQMTAWVASISMIYYERKYVLKNSWKCFLIFLLVSS